MPAHKLIAIISSLSTHLMPIIKANKNEMKNSIHITKHLITVTLCQLLTHVHFANLAIFHAYNIQVRRLKNEKILKSEYF